MLLTGALMGLVFLSSGTGHDESVADLMDDDLEDLACRRRGVEAILFNRFAADQMLFDNLFQRGFIAGMIPYPVRPDDRDRAMRADLQAIRL